MRTNQSVRVGSKIEWHGGICSEAFLYIQGLFGGASLRHHYPHLEFGLIVFKICTYIVSLFRKNQETNYLKINSLQSQAVLVFSVQMVTMFTARSAHLQVLSKYQFCQSTLTKNAVCSGRKERHLFSAPSLVCPLWCPVPSQLVNPENWYVVHQRWKGSVSQETGISYLTW